jgi:hypothetical protein
MPNSNSGLVKRPNCDAFHATIANLTKDLVSKLGGRRRGKASKISCRCRFKAWFGRGNPDRGGRLSNGRGIEAQPLLPTDHLFA